MIMKPEERAKELWDKWETLQSDMQDKTERICVFGRSIIQNFGHPDMILTREELYEYIKRLKEEKNIEDLQKRLNDLIRETAMFMDKHVKKENDGKGRQVQLD